MDPIILIPARLGSKRLPNKVLSDIAGKSLISRIYTEAKNLGWEVKVVGDNLKILNHLMLNRISLGFDLTDFIHVPEQTNNGTERCLIGARKTGLIDNKDAHFIIWQADELISFKYVKTFFQQCIEAGTNVGNILKISTREEQEDFNQVKARVENANIIEFFHRIPCKTDFSQIGIYYHSWWSLLEYGFTLSILEQATKVELNRLISQGKIIYGHIIDYDADRQKVDTPDDRSKLVRKVTTCPDFPSQ